MKNIFAPIEVTEERGRPRRIRWRGRVYHVLEMLEVWVYQSRWWSNEERRIYFRLWTSRGMLEIWRSGKKWILGRILD